MASEQLMVRYFNLDPMLSQQYDKVWRWIDCFGRDWHNRPFTMKDQIASGLLLLAVLTGGAATWLLVQGCDSRAPLRR